MNRGHSCYRCRSHDDEGPFRQQGQEDAPELESIETTFSEKGDKVYFISGYSAREIAQQRAKEIGGRIYVNNISPKIKRREMTKPVSYAVSQSPVYTLRAPDQWHDKVYRCYWPPLE